MIYILKTEEQLRKELAGLLRSLAGRVESNTIEDKLSYILDAQRISVIENVLELNVIKKTTNTIKIH